MVYLLGFQMQILLQTWPKLEPEQALELLDYTFADQEVRKVAVECIEKMRCELLFSRIVEFTQVPCTITQNPCALICS